MQVQSLLYLCLLCCCAVSVPFIVVVKFEGDKLKAERIYWDQVSRGCPVAACNVWTCRMLHCQLPPRLGLAEGIVCSALQ